MMPHAANAGPPKVTKHFQPATSEGALQAGALRRCEGPCPALARSRGSPSAAWTQRRLARTGRRCPRATARWRLTHGTGSSGHRCAARSGPGQRGPAAQEVLDCGVPSRPRRPLQRERALHEEVPSSNTTVRYALGRARRALSGQKPGGVPTHPGPAVSRHQPGGLAAPGASACLGTRAARSRLGDEEAWGSLGAEGAVGRWGRVPRVPARPRPAAAFPQASPGMGPSH